MAAMIAANAPVPRKMPRAASSRTVDLTPQVRLLAAASRASLTAADPQLRTIRRHAQARSGIRTPEAAVGGHILVQGHPYMKGAP